MEEILKFDTISQYNAFNRNETLHPLVSVVDLSKAAPRQLRRMSYGFYTDRNGEWEKYRIMMVFLTTTYYSGTNQVMAPNPSTNTSTHTIPSDWHDMKRCGASFITVLNRFTKEQGLINTAFRLDQEREKIFSPVSEVGVDRASGVKLEFMASVLIGCELEDYDEADIASIEVPEKDSHPEHQL